MASSTRGSGCIRPRSAGCLVGRTISGRRPTCRPNFPALRPTPESIADRKWFDLFQDDTLQQLVTTALEHNFDVRIAAERVLEARAQYGITRANLFPTLDASGQFTAIAQFVDRFIPVHRAGHESGHQLHAGRLAVQLGTRSVGRLRRLNEAARAQYLASEEARNGVIISLISDVMNTYFALREQDLELEISQQNSDIAQDNLRLIKVRKDRGAANGLDVHQAEQFLYTTTAQIASVQRSIAQAEDALSLLLGNAPGEIPRGKNLEQITAPPELPAGLPSSLLERRPDIRQAEENLIAANAQIGAARALFFPDISLTGFLGSQSRVAGRHVHRPRARGTSAPTRLLPIFHAGLRAGVQLTEAQQREMLITYQKTIYGALREVSDALAAHTRTREQRAKKRSW